MIHVGIIGVGPAWETRYRPALEALRARIRVHAVYDAVATRAELAAAPFQAAVAPGIHALLDRRDVRAILLLDRAWQRDVPLAFLCARGKPVFVAGSLGTDPAAVARIHERATAAGLTIMPEFSLRFTPATCRLQELIATRLGRPHRVEIDVAVAGPNESAPEPGLTDLERLMGLLDWGCHIVRTPPASVTAERRDDDVHQITVRFARPRSGGGEPVAVLRLLRTAPAAEAPVFRALCERGRAVLSNARTIVWTSADHEAAESLVSERSEVEVMLDHFCRRVAGGLIPIADTADALRAVELARAAEDSLRRGQAVVVGRIS